MKKLIIVCDEKHRKYGDYLSQLISLEDDTEDCVVGIKDGEVATQVWSEKEYQSNAPQISSSQYILFIGESKLIKEKGLHMKAVFSKYGMRYGWLGKQAILTVEESISVKEYDEFLNFALDNQADIERLVEKKENKSFVDKVKENPMVGAKVAGIAALGVLGGAVGLSPIIGLKIKRTIDLKKGIREQQYSCAIIKFYLEGLSAFLGM
ncbi:hypothetical protein [Streptococcus cristatus]|uniref:Uncharacterized protein n=1 Tax=Streptococcus cristatus TaxID=45634 RepID=A0A139N3X0_STRCR|nr:hypothetical protein [Streptococcus cristatus]KXT70735.1 hypothetical protein SCRDD08_00495 [Streptococcus cristatus]